MKSAPVVTISRSPFNRMATEANTSARAVGLRYVLDSTPGIERRRQGKNVRYVRPNGTIIRDPGSLRRIASLVIPPAWTDIWICTDPHGHLQATGRDARGRKQYRYHQRWNDVRNEDKYDRMLTFVRLLLNIRKRVIEDLRLPGLPRDKILAAVVRLLETTLIRVGNEEYARVNDSFGLTTLRDRHVQVKGPRVRFEFRGKSGILHNVDVTDRRLARIVKRSQDLPGYELFQYVDPEGARHSITSSDVNEYLQRIAGREVTAKDFRTWAGDPSGGARSPRLRRPLQFLGASQAQYRGGDRGSCEAVGQYQICLPQMLCALGSFECLSRRHVDSRISQAGATGAGPIMASPPFGRGGRPEITA